MIWLFLALYGFDWRRLALRMGDMDWSIHYYIYLMSRRVVCLVNEGTRRQVDKEIVNVELTLKR